MYQGGFDGCDLVDQIRNNVMQIRVLILDRTIERANAQLFEERIFHKLIFDLS